MAYFANMNAVDLLKDGATDSNLQILIQLTWDNGDNGATQRFTFSESTVKAVYGSNGGSAANYGETFEMVITGISSVENLRANIVVVSGINAAYISAENPITG